MSFLLRYPPLNWIAMAWDYSRGLLYSACASQIRYVIPFLAPLNPLNIFNWAIFFTIFFIILAIPANFVNSSDGNTKNGWRVLLISSIIYYGIMVILSTLALFAICYFSKENKDTEIDSFFRFVPGLENLENLTGLSIAGQTTTGPKKMVLGQPIQQLPVQQLPTQQLPIQQLPIQPIQQLPVQPIQAIQPIQQFQQPTQLMQEQQSFVGQVGGYKKKYFVK